MDQAESTYVPSAAESAGAAAYLAGGDFMESLRSIAIEGIRAEGKTDQDIIREWMIGWEKEHDRKLAAENKDFAERQAMMRFERGRILTINMRVEDPDQTSALFMSMYSKQPFLLGGCRVDKIGLVNQMDKYEQLKIEMLQLLVQHGVVVNA